MPSTAIRNESFDRERALYGLSHATLENVRFAGPADQKDIPLDGQLTRLHAPCI